MKKIYFIISVLFCAAVSGLEAQDSTESEGGKLPTTTIEFEETEYYFGKLVQGDVIFHAYKFTNTGKEPLVIEHAKGSCSCAIPVWPTEPIAPGISGEIIVEYNSKDKHGPQAKQFTITANTEPPQSILYIKGEVFFADDKALIGYDRVVDLNITNNLETDSKSFEKMGSSLKKSKELEDDMKRQKVKNEKINKEMWRLERSPLPNVNLGVAGIRMYPEDSFDDSIYREIIAKELGVDPYDFDLPETKIEFDESELVFGKINEGELLEYAFRFANIGKEPLKILSVDATCGCTIAGWPKDPIIPGGAGAIIVRFRTKGHPGIQERGISVLANTDPSYTILSIKGEVVGEQPVDDAERALMKSYHKSWDWEEKNNYFLAEVYPDSSGCSYVLKIEGAKGMSTDMEIFDDTGQLVRMEALKEWLGQLKLDFTCYPEGTYWISLKIGNTERFSLPFKVGS